MKQAVTFTDYSGYSFSGIYLDLILNLYKLKSICFNSTAQI